MTGTSGIIALVLLATSNPLE